ncbi:outer membrane receptor protein involved in Fe transport [Mucilaginibacter frigoritolerans]|uniref:Outer membrane receptor protein involved in Fe transport n=1 Tax=Mucilaginibacter frigoritolerans TaxID=652788 RepID=A0A562TNQ9_9SPHI|nr:TonB-dependent receptor [Mucilaginibacter frigoritolerans]TWI95053.1 outer membrane receptor protein involved in Fe transport [Mucilaginibacter frigoritolerans]
MKYFLITLLFTAFLIPAFGQVSGILIDTANRPVAFATVSLMKSNIQVSTLLSDEKGAFQLDGVISGNYQLKVSMVGYQTWLSSIIEVSAMQRKIDLGRIVLKENKQQLGEVVIRANKPAVEQQAGGLTVNVQNSILTKGSSALQVLQQSPGVVLNPSNNTIALNGKPGVNVMIDGKLLRLSPDQLVSMLSGMSADNIEKIELLNTPPANYDAEGNAGLINIVTKKNKRKGTNGSLTATAGYGVGEKASAAVSVNHNSGNINWYSNYSYQHDRSYDKIFADGTENVGVVGGPVTFNYTGLGKPLTNDESASGGVDIHLNPKTTVGGNFYYSFGQYDQIDNNYGFYALKPDSVLVFNSHITGINHANNLMSSLYWERTISKTEKIRADADYLAYHTNITNNVQSSFLNNQGKTAGAGDSLYSPLQRSLANTLIQVGVAKVDYSGQLNAKWKIESGIKGTYTHTSSSSGIENLVDGQWIANSVGLDGDLAYNETIGAVYAMLTAQLDTATNLVIGGRYEYSRNVTEPGTSALYAIDRKLGMLFPDIVFSKKLSADAGWQLSYTSRISRPSYNDLAAFVTYNDPVSVFTGNPMLLPTVSHNLKFGFNKSGYLFSLLVSRDDHPILETQITTGSTPGLVYLRPENADWQNSITLQATIPVKISDWWNMSYTITGGPKQYRVSYTPQAFEKAYLSGTFNFTETFSLPKHFSAELSGYYNSPSYYGNFSSNSNSMINLGFKKELENNGGTFQLSVSDLLNDANYRSKLGELTRDAFSSSASVGYLAETSRVPVFKLTYYRSFGSSASKKSNKTGEGTEEEQRRLGN